MKDYSFKTRFLNQIRNIGKLPPVERMLVRLSERKLTNNLAVKLAPNNYQYLKNTRRVCLRDGIKYQLDISDYMQYCMYYRVDTEPREKLYGLVKNGTTVIDVGTNFGETLLNFALINRNGVNVGFEPVPFLFEEAEQNIKLNHFENIILENLALSDVEATLIFNFDNSNNSGGIYLSSGNDKGELSQSVKAIKLDDYVEQNNLSEISLIKIDVEGFEMKVIAGATKTILKHRPTMFVEVNESFLMRQQSSARELINFFQTNGYRIFYAEDGNEVRLNDEFQGRHFDVVCIST